MKNIVITSDAQFDELSDRQSRNIARVMKLHEENDMIENALKNYAITRYLELRDDEEEF